MNLEQAEAWIAPKALTENEVALVHLLVKGTINGHEKVL